MDLEKFFDRVNHDKVMSEVGKRISDKRVNQLILRFLRSGIAYEGKLIKPEIGPPQGGPLSPLLANLMLDNLDRELERRGHLFVRYADANIYVKSKRAGVRFSVVSVIFQYYGSTIYSERTGLMDKATASLLPMEAMGPLPIPGVKETWSKQ